MKDAIDAGKEFFGRYKQTFVAAWDIRKQLDPPHRTEDERAFLPAQLELIESPVSPQARWVMRAIIAFFIIALLWAIFGKLDIVAVAAGKTAVDSRTKVIQPLESAVVRNIRVQDGQAVKKGDLLVELDATATGSDYQQAGESLTAAKLAEVRYDAMAQALDTGHLPANPPDRKDLDPNRLMATWQLTRSDFANFQAQQGKLESTIRQQQDQAQTVRIQIEPLQRSFGIARDRVAAMEPQLGTQYVSRFEYLQYKQEMVDTERQLAAQQASLVAAQSAIAEAREELRVLVADTKQKTFDGLRQAREQIGQYAPQVAKTEQRNELMQLRAPVDGTVQQLAIHTVGGVVTPAQNLMAIVPSEEALEVEATVLNQDIGFVHPGERASIKIDSFPYTRYGYLEGTVETVSHDAAQDDKLGLIFPARVKLDRTSLNIDGTQVSLTPGMSVSVEIKTGKRRVIDYLLSPLQQHTQEAMRER